MRNSSLVQGFCAENDRDSSLLPKLWIPPFGVGMVEERSTYLRRYPVRGAGGSGNEDASMSSDNSSEKLEHRKSKVS